MRNLMTETNMQVQIPVGLAAPAQGPTAFEIRFRDEKIEVIDITPRRTSKGERVLPSAFQKRDLIPRTPTEASFRHSSRNYHNTYLGLDGIPQPSSKRNSILMDDTAVAYRTSCERLPMGVVPISQIPRLVKTPNSQSSTEGPITCPAEPPKTRIPKPKKVAYIEQKLDQNEISAPPKSNNISPPPQSNIPQLQPRSKLRQRVYSSPAAMLKDELAMPMEPLPQHIPSKIPKAPLKDEPMIPTGPLPQHTTSKIPKASLNSTNSDRENFPETLSNRDATQRGQRDPQVSSERSMKQTKQSSIVEITPPQIPAGPAIPTKSPFRTPMQTPKDSTASEPSALLAPVTPVTPAAPATPASTVPVTPASTAPVAPPPSFKSYHSIEEELPPVIAKREKERSDRENEKAEALKIEHEEHMRRVERRIRHKEEAKQNAKMTAQLNSSRGPAISDFSELPIKGSPLEGDIATQSERIPKTKSWENFEMQRISVVEQQNRDVETASQRSMKRRQRMNDDVKKNKFCCCVIS